MRKRLFKIRSQEVKETYKEFDAADKGVYYERKAAIELFIHALDQALSALKMYFDVALELGKSGVSKRYGKRCVDIRQTNLKEALYNVQS